MKKFFKRLLVLLLTFSICFSTTSTNVFATDTQKINYVQGKKTLQKMHFGKVLPIQFMKVIIIMLHFP